MPQALLHLEHIAIAAVKLYRVSLSKSVRRYVLCNPQLSRFFAHIQKNRLPVFCSITVGRKFKRSIRKPKTSETRRPVASAISQTSRFAGVSCAVIAASVSNSTNPARILNI